MNDDATQAAERLHEWDECFGQSVKQNPYTWPHRNHDFNGDVKLVNRAYLALTSRIATHDAECWQQHHLCAVAEVERLAKERDELSAALLVGDDIDKGRLPAFDDYSRYFDTLAAARTRLAKETP